MDIMQLVVIATQRNVDFVKGKPVISPPRTIPNPKPMPQTKEKKTKKIKE